MQAYNDDQKDKGLFTFYLEQAELQQKLKQDRKIIKQEEYQKKEKKDKKLPMYHHQKYQQETPSKANIILEPKQGKSQESKQQKEDQHFLDNQEKSKKIVELLEKQKYKSRKMKNIRLIVGDSQAEDEDNAHLEQLLKEEKKRNVEQANKVELEYQGHYNPFQKLYLPQKNFETYFQQQMIGHSRKVQPLKTKSYESQLFEPKKEKNQGKDEFKRIEGQKKSLQEIYHKNLLPKIDFRCVSHINSEMIPSSQLYKAKSKSMRSKKDHYLHEMKSQLSRYPKQESLCIQSARYNSSNHNSQKRHERQLYSVFLQNEGSSRYEQESKQSKQQMYLDILKKLKFK